MKTAVQKWGNSLALRIPKAYAAETQIADGSEVELTMKGGSLVIRPVLKRRLPLARLLKGITSANCHGHVTTGAPVGREVW